MNICETFSGNSLKEDLSIDTTFDPCYFSWDSPFNQQSLGNTAGRSTIYDLRSTIYVLRLSTFEVYGATKLQHQFKGTGAAQ